MIMVTLRCAKHGGLAMSILLVNVSNIPTTLTTLGYVSINSDYCEAWRPPGTESISPKHQSSLPPAVQFAVSRLRTDACQVARIWQVRGLPNVRSLQVKELVIFFSKVCWRHWNGMNLVVFFLGLCKRIATPRELYGMIGETILNPYYQ